MDEWYEGLFGWEKWSSSILQTVSVKLSAVVGEQVHQSTHVIIKSSISVLEVDRSIYEKFPKLIQKWLSNVWRSVENCI